MVLQKQKLTSFKCKSQFKVNNCLAPWKQRYFQVLLPAAPSSLITERNDSIGDLSVFYMTCPVTSESPPPDDPFQQIQLVYLRNGVIQKDSGRILIL